MFRKPPVASILKDYFDALERLKKGRPENVHKRTKITNDSVSLEAGRKKGTIKRSRPIFSDLIAAIDAAAAEHARPGDEIAKKLAEAKAEAAKYRALWDEALTREVSLVKELCGVREDWEKEKAAMRAGKVTSINAKKVRGIS